MKYTVSENTIKMFSRNRTTFFHICSIQEQKS